MFALTFLLWWPDLMRVPVIDSWDGQTVRFVPAAIWTTLVLPDSLFVARRGVAIYLVDLVRPWRTLTVSLIDLALDVYNVVIVTIALRAGHFVEVIGDPGYADRDWRGPTTWSTPPWNGRSSSWPRSSCSTSLRGVADEAARRRRQAVCSLA